jgi:hypothetical protein
MQIPVTVVINVPDGGIDPADVSEFVQRVISHELWDKSSAWDVVDVGVAKSYYTRRV